MKQTEQIFRIRGLDCAEEVATLKDVLTPLVGNADLLSFDILNGKLMVAPNEGAYTDSDLVRAVQRTGMEAIPWSQYIARQGEEETLWQRHGRLICCMASLLFLIAGFAWHGVAHSWWDAIGRHSEEHMYPLLSRVAYGFAIVTAYAYVAPKAWFALRALRADMNVLMTVACLGALGIGEWMEGATVAFLFSFALVLETWSVGRARRSISSLMDAAPETARTFCTHDKKFEERPVDSVAVGALIQVRPSERIPLDGEIETGSSHVNQAPITGESVPVERGIADPVYAGSINGEGLLEIRVTKTAEHSTLGRMMAMIETAQSRRSDSEQWVERFARIYTPVMMLLSLLIMVGIPLLEGGPWYSGVYQGLVLLVIACPCALVISTPISVVSALSTAARHGVLIKGGKYLELAGNLNAIAIDKTGTLTQGKVYVQEIVALNGHSPDELLARAAALEAHSEHPIAAAILQAAREHCVTVAPCIDFSILPGMGARGRFDDREFWLGNQRYMRERDVETKSCESEAARLEANGSTVVAIGNDRHVCGLISVSDSVREGAHGMVQALESLGVRPVVMLTGDNTPTARAIARLAGITDFRAELMPEEKVEAVSELVGEYGRVAMIGDGINDAPAMAASSLGIAMGAAGSDAAIETADVALMSDDLLRIPWLIQHSRRTLGIIKQNIAFALGLKVVFVLLTFAGVATLWMAIAADMGASLLVIFNGLRLLQSHEDEMIPLEKDY